VIASWAYIKTRRKGYIWFSLCFLVVLVGFFAGKLQMKTTVAREVPPEIREKIEQRGEEINAIIKKYGDIDVYAKRQVTRRPILNGLRIAAHFSPVLLLIGLWLLAWDDVKRCRAGSGGGGKEET
jgi:hypothetical protein